MIDIYLMGQVILYYQGETNCIPSTGKTVDSLLNTQTSVNVLSPISASTVTEVQTTMFRKEVSFSR